MKKVSDAYKTAMEKIVRNQAYISVVLAEVNPFAQSDASISTQGTYYSDSSTPFNDDAQTSEYATFEQNFTLANGKSLIVPREGQGTYNKVGYVSENILEAVTISFGVAYAMKGITIDFGAAYPTKLKITTDIDTEGVIYENDKKTFVTVQTFGTISSITITPLEMVGGNQRLRIKRVSMGVVLTYDNEVVSNAELTEEISGISENIPDTRFDITIIDEKDEYNVNNEDSFIDYLITGQPVTISYGVALDDSDDPEIEWLQTQKLYLTDWASEFGEFTFSASNIFADLDDTYTLGNTIHTRTAMQEAVSIFTDLGLTADDYMIDDYLNDITLTNPMPEDTHTNCLLLLCNACRCIYFQDSDGVIHIQGNFQLNIEPEDITLTSVGETAYSTPNNILTEGAVTTHYADFTKDFASADGSMLILPRNSADYDGLTGFVSQEIADSNGEFITNPSITLDLQAGYIFYGVMLNFAGTPPEEITIDTFYNGSAVETFTFTNILKENVFYADFQMYDAMTITVTKGVADSRVLIDYVGLGNITDYILDKDNMTSFMVGTKEELSKDVRVKIYTFQNDGEGNPQEVEDDVWYTETLNSTGVHREVKNPLISSSAMAQDLAEWLGVYYSNNYEYDVDYRGDPRINAADIIRVEDEYKPNLQVAIAKATLSFNGAFRGKLSMRRAMKRGGE